MFRWGEWTATSGARGGTAKISEVGRSKTQDTPPDYGTNTEYDPLLEGLPVEYIKHVGRYMSTCPVIGMPPMRLYQEKIGIDHNYSDWTVSVAVKSGWVSWHHLRLYTYLLCPMPRLFQQSTDCHWTPHCNSDLHSIFHHVLRKSNEPW